MANAEQLAILKQGVKIWNTWLREHFSVYVDMSAIHLGSADLNDTNFSNVVLTSTKVLEAKWSKTKSRHDNISDWGLNQFRKHYKPLNPDPSPQGGEGGNNSRGEGSGLREGDPLGTRGVPGHLIAFARQLRKDSTDAEDILWQLLRNRQLNGAKFRRQHPVATGYILDFYCAECRLAIEVDGSIHDLPEQAAYDAKRTQHLEQFNVKVIRFSNAEVLTQTEWVLSVINTYLSSSSLPPQGEGSGLRGQRRARTIQKEDIFHYVYEPQAGVSAHPFVR